MILFIGTFYKLIANHLMHYFQSIEFHEKGKNHKENVKRRLAQVSILDGMKIYTILDIIERTIILNYRLYLLEF